MHWCIIHCTHIPFIALNVYRYRLISSHLFADFFLFFRFQPYTKSQDDLTADFPNGAKSAKVVEGTWIAFGNIGYSHPIGDHLNKGNSYKNPEEMALCGPIYSIQIKQWDIVSSW